MKRYIKECILMVLQLFMFYIFPFFAGPTDAIGMVVLILFATIVLSFLMGILSKEYIKYTYPAVVALVFIPTVFIHYNETALVHAIWYLVVSIPSLLLGAWVRVLIERIINKDEKA